jgi:hypothetical protein
MATIIINTSVKGDLWTVGKWKSLIDSLCVGGSKNDPRLSHRDLIDKLDDYIHCSNGRFLPSRATLISSCDDTAVEEIRLSRVPVGEESIEIVQTRPNPEGFHRYLCIPFFGTIGSSGLEAQTKRNLTFISDQWFSPPNQVVIDGSVSLGFQLSSSRRDRDLDNLADPIMSLFKRMSDSRIESIVLRKLPPKEMKGERLYLL